MPIPLPSPLPAPASDACYSEFSSEDCSGVALYRQNLTFNTCNVVTPIVIPDFSVSLNLSEIVMYSTTMCGTITNSPGYDVCVDSLSGGSEVFSVGSCFIPFTPPIPGKKSFSSKVVLIICFIQSFKYMGSQRSKTRSKLQR